MPDFFHQPNNHSAEQHLLQQWQNNIVKGNAYYDQKNWSSALELYKNSLNIAEQLLDQNSDNSLHAYIISRHNLADLYVQLNLLEHAKEQLETAKQKAEEILHAYNVSADLKRDAQQAYSKTHIEIVKFFKQHPTLFQQAPVLSSKATTPPMYLH